MRGQVSGDGKARRRQRRRAMDAEAGRGGKPHLTMWGVLAMMRGEGERCG